MKAILSDGRQVRLVFRHIHALSPSEKRTPGERLPKIIAMTAASLLGGTREVPEEVCPAGVAACSSKDPFVKEIGRQVSLRRLVAGLSSEDAGRVLRAYFERPRAPRSPRSTHK